MKNPQKQLSECCGAKMTTLNRPLGEKNDLICSKCRKPQCECKNPPLCPPNIKGICPDCGGVKPPEYPKPSQSEEEAFNCECEIVNLKCGSCKGCGISRYFEFSCPNCNAPAIKNIEYSKFTISSQLTEEDRELLRNWRKIEPWGGILEPITNSKKEYQEMISIKNVEKLLAAKSREADERVKAAYAKGKKDQDDILYKITDVYLKYLGEGNQSREVRELMRRTHDEAVRLERERFIKILKTTSYTPSITAFIESVEAQILNPLKNKL